MNSTTDQQERFPAADGSTGAGVAKRVAKGSREQWAVLAVGAGIVLAWLALVGGMFAGIR